MVLVAFIASGTFGNASAEGAAFAATGSAAAMTSSQAAPLTPAQMHDSATMLASQMGQETLAIRRQLDEARRRRDIVRILCLDDKVKQADLVIGSARDRVSSLDHAAKRDDAERALHELTVIEALRERMRTVSMEVGQCVGEELGFIDDAKVVVEIDPRVPPLDPTGLPADAIFSEPPMVSSPTR